MYFIYAKLILKFSISKKSLHNPHFIGWKARKKGAIAR